ncbi:MAG: hypothetical protein ACRCXA_11935 [Peptostreptococcaceae bacterium]
MSKKRGLWFNLGLIVLFSVLIFFRCSIIDSVEIIRINWDIELPKNSKEIFYESSEVNFLGDGEKYSVYKCEDEKSISVALDWKDDENKEIVDGFKDVIHSIKSYEGTKIPDEYIPNLTNGFLYYHKVLDDNSKIYIMYIPGDSRIYISEDIL